MDHSLAADVISRLAREVWGDEVGQVVVGREHVYVFAAQGTAPLLHLQHRLAYEASIVALTELVTWGRAPDITPTTAGLAEAACEPCGAATPCAVLEHAWTETGRDVGAEGGPSAIFERCTLCGAEQTREADTLAECAG